MRDEPGYRLQRISAQDIAAAWICCALAAVAGALIIARANTDTSGREPYAGVYLPGRDVVRALDRRNDDFDEETEQAEGPAQSQPEPTFCPARANPRYAAAKPPTSTAPPLNC